jgi:hypothetical protein
MKDKTTPMNNYKIEIAGKEMIVDTTKREKIKINKIDGKITIQGNAGVTERKIKNDLSNVQNQITVKGMQVKVYEVITVSEEESIFELHYCEI